MSCGLNFATKPAKCQVNGAFCNASYRLFLILWEFGGVDRCGLAKWQNKLQISRSSFKELSLV
jgi:hypothetical protein